MISPYNTYFLNFLKKDGTMLPQLHYYLTNPDNFFPLRIQCSDWCRFSAGRAAGNAVSETIVKPTISGSNARISLDNVNTILEQISDAKESRGNSLLPALIDVDIGSARSLSIPSPSEIAGTGASLRVVSVNGTVEISNPILTNVVSGKSGDLTININTVDRNELMKDHRDRLGPNDVIFDVTVYVGSTPVHQMGGNVTVSIPFVIPRGTSIDDVNVWYLKDDGTLERMNFAYKNGCVVFVTNHLSYFAVGYPESSESVGMDTTLMIMIVMVIAIVALAVALSFVLGRSSGIKSERS
jgi:hypothetical protein